MSIFVSYYFFILESILSDISMPTSALLGMLFVWRIIIHPFTLNLPFLCRQHRLGFVFLSYLLLSASVSVNTVHLHLPRSNYWYMRISYSHFIFCFQVVLCLLDPLVRRPVLNPLSHTSQDGSFLLCVWVLYLFGVIPYFFPLISFFLHYVSQFGGGFICDYH